MRVWRTGLAGLALWAGLAAGSLAQEAEPQPEPRFTAFQDVCIDARQSYAAMISAAAAQGWTSVEESVRPELPRAVQQARNMATGGLELREMAVLSRPVAGDERAYLVLSLLDRTGEPVIGCSFYAFDAPQAVPPQLVRDWVGYPATDWRQRQDSYVAQYWVDPPSMPGVKVFRYIFVQRAADAAPDTVGGMILMVVAAPNEYAPSVDPNEGAATGS